MLAMWILIALVGSALFAYSSVLGFLYLRQRSIMFLPDGNRIAPSEAGLPQAEDLELSTRDGEQLVAWFVAPAPGHRLILYCHGNAGNLANLAPRFGVLTAQGAGLLAIDYRGFGGSSGSPSEAGLALDADAAYAEALARGFSAHDIVVVGESLGTAVAAALAARSPCAGVILEAAFPSTTDVAAVRYRAFPVRRLLHDRFESQTVIGRVRAPLLFLHGTLDLSIPIHFGQALYASAPQPKTFIAVEGGGHQVLQLQEIAEQVAAWIAALPRRALAPGAAISERPVQEEPLRAT